MGSRSDGEKSAEQMPAGAGGEDRVEAKIDRDLKDSFPASDPPGWVLGVDRRPAGKKEEGEGDETPSVEEEED